MWTNQFTSSKIGYIFCIGLSLGVLAVTVLLLIKKELYFDDLQQFKNMVLEEIASVKWKQKMSKENSSESAILIQGV